MKLSIILFLLLSLPLQAKPCKKITTALMELYPDQSKKMIVTRIENAKNKHMFMRAFIPYYYEEAFALKETLPVYNKMKNHVGQIVGDAHVGNFGYMVNNQGKSILVLNDFDDVAEAPLFLDIMRLSQSASYVDEFQQAKLLEAYRKGVSGSSYEFSDFIKKLGAKAQKGGNQSKAEFTTTANGPRFAIKAEPSKAITKEVETSLKTVLTEKFGKNTKLHDAYLTMKESGGSAFGTRYHALMEVDGEMHFVEFKEIMDGGVVSSWLPKKVTNEERILKARKTFLGNEFDQKLDVVEVEGKSFQLRFKAEGNKSIDVKKALDTELPGIIEDEFFVLGQLHRKSLGNNPAQVSEYLSDFDRVTAAEWEESVKLMKQKIKKAYDKGNQ
jgi:hypothetical protein